MPFFPVNRPTNSVDIRGDDGLMYHGRVVDCAEEGLVVNDLGDDTCRLVPFGQIYCTYPDFDPLELTERMPVEALVRLQLTEPARWYPGSFLAGEVRCRRSFGLVLITTPEGTFMEVLPTNRILENRTERKGISSLVKKGQFSKKEVALPNGVSSGSPSPGPYKTPAADQHLVECFNMRSSGENRMATHIDGGILHVLKGDGRYCLFGISRPCNRELKGLMLLHMLGLGPRDRLIAERKRQEENDGGMDANAMASVDMVGTMDFKPINRYLPKELLADVFTYLDSLKQVRLRKVCSKWNDILTALPVSRTVCVGVSEGEEESSVVHISTLCKQWTGQTKIIVNSVCAASKSTDEDSYEKYAKCKPLLCSARLLRCIMQERQLSQLEIVVLVNITSNWLLSPLIEPNCHFSYFVKYICEQLNSFTTVCHSLVLKNVTVEAVALEYGQTAAVVHISKGRVVGEIPVEVMWSMMEECLPPFSDVDLDLWLEVVQTADDELLEILAECQSADPRASNKFRNKRWTSEDLPVLAPSTLNRIAFYSILKISNCNPLVLRLGW